MKFKKIFSVLFSALTVFSVSSFSGIFANEIDDAELLYTKMTEFLSKNNNINPEKIDDVCKEIIGSKIPESNLLSKQDFEEKSVGNTILYRGVENKAYADEFKNGKAFISCWNVRGSGIYTTTSLDCAKSFASKQNPDDTLIKAFFSKYNVKTLNNDYLEKLKGKEVIVLFFMFLLPVFPDDLLCSVAGIMPTISYPVFIIMQLITRATSIFGTLLFMSGEYIPLYGWGLFIIIPLGIIAIIAFIYSMKNSDKINDKLISTIDKIFKKKDK